jgi:hypothetical protein
MRKTRIGKRICVHRVPLDTAWFCPYCCATVDTALVTLRGTASTARTSLLSSLVLNRAEVVVRLALAIPFSLPAVTLSSRKGGEPVIWGVVNTSIDGRGDSRLTERRTHKPVPVTRTCRESNA